MAWWSEEDIELLKKLAADGLSASQIAVELGGRFSRNSVLGKAWRCKACLHASPGKYARTGAQNGRRKSVAAGGPSRVRLPHQPEIDPNEPTGPGVSIIELTVFSCRWPADGARGGGYCGAAKEFNRPYCPFHIGKARAPAGTRRKSW